MKRLIAITLLFASPAWALPEDELQALKPAPVVVDVERAVITTPKGETVTVSDGCWLETKRCIAAGKALAGDDAEKQVLRDAVPNIPWTIASFVVGLAIGGAIGVGVVLAVKR